MNNINIKALIETIRDCEYNPSFIYDSLSDLGQAQPSLFEAITKSYPDKIGYEGLIGFIDAIVPDQYYNSISEYITLRYMAKLHPFWVMVKINPQQTALTATVRKMGILPDMVFTEENWMYTILDKLMEKNIDFQLHFLASDARYPHNKSGVLEITGFRKNSVNSIGMGDSAYNKGDIVFFTDHEALQHYKFSYLEISGGKLNGGQYERCDDSEVETWILYGRYADGEYMAAKAIAHCKSRSIAESLKTFVETLLAQWGAPTCNDYSIVN